MATDDECANRMLSHPPLPQQRYEMAAWRPDPEPAPRWPFWVGMTVGAIVGAVVALTVRTFGG